MQPYIRIHGGRPAGEPDLGTPDPPHSLPCNGCGHLEKYDLSRYTLHPDRVEFALVPLSGVDLEAAMRQTTTALANAVQHKLDAVAAQRGYGDARMPPSLSARAYAGYPNRFQAEGIAYGQWVSACWDVCFQVLAEGQAGARPIPTKAQLLMELPVMVWPGEEG